MNVPLSILFIAENTTPNIEEKQVQVSEIIAKAIAAPIAAILSKPWGWAILILLVFAGLLWKHGFSDIKAGWVTYLQAKSKHKKITEDKLDQAIKQVQQQFEERIKLLEKLNDGQKLELSDMRSKYHELHDEYSTMLIKYGELKGKLENYENQIRELREQNSGLRAAFIAARTQSDIIKPMQEETIK